MNGLMHRSKQYCYSITSSARASSVRDPLHDLIEFNVERSQLEDVLWRVLQTRPFQRLRRIKQLGFSDFVYPGATHSRLLHSLGVFHTARRLMRVIDKYVPAKDAKADQAVAAALLHDLGHGPFSHAFEKIGERFKFKMANHEAVSDQLIRDSEVTKLLREIGSGFADDVADMVSGNGTPTIYSAVVSSQFDANHRKVDTAGEIADANAYYTGTFRGNSFSGTFSTGQCNGTFTMART